MDRKLCGAQDKHLELLRNAFSCDIIMRDNELRILSEDAVTFHSIESVVKALFNMMEAHIDVSGRDIEYACRLAKLNRLQELSTTYQKAIGKTVNGKLIYPKTIGQRHLFKCMCNSEIVFATGVAGTGKTYLAVVYAADLLKKGEIRKIILTRPAVEAGENLGLSAGRSKGKGGSVSCAHSMMPCMIRWDRSRWRSCWKRKSLKSRRLLICADGRWTMPSLYWMRRRIQLVHR